MLTEGEVHNKEQITQMMPSDHYSSHQVWSASGDLVAPAICNWPEESKGMTILFPSSVCQEMEFHLPKWSVTIFPQTTLHADWRTQRLKTAQPNVASSIFKKMI